MRYMGTFNSGEWLLCWGCWTMGGRAKLDRIVHRAMMTPLVLELDVWAIEEHRAELWLAVCLLCVYPEVTQDYAWALGERE